MQSIMFRLTHKLSKSRALVEFEFKNGEVKLVDCGFIKGNVVNLNAYRMAKATAKEMFAAKQQGK
jgi:hypothetical protein